MSNYKKVLNIMLKRRKPIICTSDKPQEIITKADCSRTIRQILEDTAMGRPSPVELTPMPEDAKRGISESDMHELRVVEDKFDAINSQRRVTEKVREKVFFNKKQEKEAVEKARETIAQLRRDKKEKEKERAQRETTTTTTQSDQ